MKQESSHQVLTEELAAMQDRVEVMMALEQSTYKRQQNMLHKYVPDAVDSNWRQMIVVWMNNIVQIFHLKPCILEVGMYLADSSVRQGLVSESTDYQLVALTSLHLAMKLYEVKLFPMRELLKLSHGAFRDDDVADMETRILKALQWKLHPPTAHCFIEQLSHILLHMECSTLRKDVMRQCRKLVFEMVQEDGWTSATPSRVAYGCMLVALEQEGQNAGMGLDEFQMFVDVVDELTGIAFDDVELVLIVDYLIDGNMPPHTQKPKSKHKQTPSQSQSQVHQEKHPSGGVSISSTSSTEANSDSEDELMPCRDGSEATPTRDDESKRIGEALQEKRDPSVMDDNSPSTIVRNTCCVPTREVNIQGGNRSNTSSRSSSQHVMISP